MKGAITFRLETESGFEFEDTIPVIEHDDIRSFRKGGAINGDPFTITISFDPPVVFAWPEGEASA